MKNRLVLVFLYHALLGFTLTACSSNLNSNSVKADIPSTPSSKQPENVASSTAKQDTDKKSMSTDIATQNKAVQDTLKNNLNLTKQKLLLDEINTQQAEAQFKKIRNNANADVETATSAQNLIMDLKQAELKKQDSLLETSLSDITISFANEEIDESVRDSKIYAIKKQILTNKININQAMLKETEDFKKLLKSKIKLSQN